MQVMTHFMPTWLRQAKARLLQLPGRVSSLEAAGSAGLIGQQAPLAHGHDLVEHRHEELLINPLDQLQWLEALVHHALPQTIGLVVR